jgi:hypothetical protein
MGVFCPAATAWVAAARSCPVASAGRSEEVGAEQFAQKPFSSGPYKFVEWVKDSHMTLEALITHRVPLQAAGEIFPECDRGETR